MGYKIGIDVGGTFTDFIVAAEKDQLFIAKVPTTPKNQAVGVLEGLRKIAQMEGLDLKGLLVNTDYIVHGTTVATNTMIEHNGAITGLITTKGFRDILEFRRGYKESIFNPRLPPPYPIVPRRRRIGVAERIDVGGKVIIPLNKEEVINAIKRFKEQGVGSVAVCFLFSFLNSKHEKEVEELVTREFPGVNLSLSHEILPEMREFERVSTTVVNAYISPRLSDYLTNLEDELKVNGYQHNLLVMQSNGGVMNVEYLSRKPVHTLLSGPAGGVIGGAYLGRLAGYKNFITIDMGGTSYDVCLVKGLDPERTNASWFSRYRLAVPMLDIHTIGAGGGSIAWIDPGGALRVGPQSAGADPGPICYGQGGTEPTVTDANLLLGYLNPENFLGGEMRLEVGPVKEIIKKKIADPLKIDLYPAAYGIIKIINHNMNNAIRVVSVQRGYDVREFSLIAFGGGAAIHAGIQARELGIKKIIIPKSAAAFSALGLLSADLIISKMRSYVASSENAELDRINELFDSMAAEINQELYGHNLVSPEIIFKKYIDFHYEGQTHEITTPLICEGNSVTQKDLEKSIAAYHQIHERLHTFSNPGQAVELMVLRLEGIGLTWKPPIKALEYAGEDASGASKGKREVYFEGLSGFHETPIYDGDRIKCGNVLKGPCIIEEPTTTIAVYPGQTAVFTTFENYEITVEGGK